MTDRHVGIRGSSTSAGRAGSFSTVTFRMGVCVHRPSPPNKKGAAGREHTPEDKNQAANRRANQIDVEGDQVLPLDLGSYSAPPCSTGYHTTDRLTRLCRLLGGKC
jgi:hypothetical protein